MSDFKNVEEVRAHLAANLHETQLLIIKWNGHFPVSLDKHRSKLLDDKEFIEWVLMESRRRKARYGQKHDPDDVSVDE